MPFYSVPGRKVLPTTMFPPEKVIVCGEMKKKVENDVEDWIKSWEKKEGCRKSYMKVQEYR